MTRHHLPPEYAGPARAYLAAFLGEREAVDAMHEVAADVSYWGDDSLADVLAVAHGVLLSRLRVTGEAAASWLVDELGLPADIAARVTDAESPRTDRAPHHSEQAPDAEVREDPPTLESPIESDAADEQPIGSNAPDEAPAAADDQSAPSAEGRVEPVALSSALPLRIGFDEEPLPFRIVDDPPDARWRMAAGALLVAGLVLVAVLLLSR